MFKFKNTEIYGFHQSILRAKYPFKTGEPADMVIDELAKVEVTPRVRSLGSVATGTGHDNYLKGIIVQTDVKYSQSVTSQMQRYNWWDFVSSQSRMHKLVKGNRVLVADDFTPDVSQGTIDGINHMIYIHTSNLYRMSKDEASASFQAIVHNLPGGFSMWAGITTNYLQIKTMYQQRDNHKMSAWDSFREWAEGLPHFLELTQKSKVN